MGLNEDKVAERFPRASLSGSSRVIHLGPAAKAARAFSTRVFQTPLSQVYLIRKDKRATVKRLPANHRCSATRSCIIAGMCIPPEHFLFINHKIAKWDTPCHKFSKETAWTPQCLICVCFFLIMFLFILQIWRSPTVNIIKIFFELEQYIISFVRTNEYVFWFGMISWFLHFCKYFLFLYAESGSS